MVEVCALLSVIVVIAVILHLLMVVYNIKLLGYLFLKKDSKVEKEDATSFDVF